MVILFLAILGLIILGGILTSWNIPFIVLVVIGSLIVFFRGESEIHIPKK